MWSEVSSKEDGHVSAKASAMEVDTSAAWFGTLGSCGRNEFKELGQGIVKTIIWAEMEELAQLVEKDLQWDA